MEERLFRAVELVFTAYAVPALMVPFVWLLRRLFRAASPGPRREGPDRLSLALGAHAAISTLWIGVWLALWLGVPIERGGRAAGVVCWVAYGLLNALLASLLVRFTGEYGGLPEGGGKDRLFLRFLSAVAVQPLATAGAFAALYRLMGVAYHLKAPGLGAVQEGI